MTTTRLNLVISRLKYTRVGGELKGLAVFPTIQRHSAFSRIFSDFVSICLSNPINFDLFASVQIDDFSRAALLACSFHLLNFGRYSSKIGYNFNGYSVNELN